ncbi:hypothetical protein [Xaviernesmea oryzae]|nr:hypothetical protein [Xaviernesmea oryzae]
MAFGALALAVASAMPGKAGAEDADWGCQVLLCAAASAPSWHGISYCVPPMMRLITAMARPHFSWPICHTAGTGTPGFEPYAACPAGFAPGTDRSESDNGSLAEQDRCIKTINHCLGPFASDRDGNGCFERVSRPRPRRLQPYYFDIPQASGRRRRFWFDLNE